MNADLDHELTRDQWETLKALRAPTAKSRSELNRPSLRSALPNETARYRS